MPTHPIKKELTDNSYRIIAMLLTANDKGVFGDVYL